MGSDQRVAEHRSRATISIRSAVGVGLIWDSPFGPLRFDVAYPISPSESYDKTQIFRFGGGTKF